MIKRTFQLALMACLALGASSQVSAQGVFTGGTSSSWSEATNWDNGALPVAADNVQIGNEANSGVTADFDAASATTINDLRVGNGAGSLGATGTFNMNAGSLTTNGWAFVGSDANAANTNPTVGTFNIGGTASFNAATRFYAGLGGGAGATATGTINIDGGTVVVGEGFITGANDDNTGIVNQTAGSVTSNGWVTVGENAGAQGQYNMSGGTLTTTDLTVGQAGAGTDGQFTLSGGDVDVNANMFIGRHEFGDGGATGALNIVGSAGSIEVFSDAHFGGINFTAGDAVGDLNFTADAGGVSTLDIFGSLFLNDGTSIGGSNLSVDLTGDSDFGLFGASGTLTEIVLVDNINNGVTGTFAGLAEGASIDIGGGKTGTLSYVGGDGNDITVSVFVTAIPEPSSVALISLGLFGLVARRRRS